MSKQQIFFTKLIILLSGILCANMIYAGTLTYKNTMSGKDFISESVITKIDNGYLIKGTNNFNKVDHVINTDSAFSNLKWKYTYSEEGTDIIAERSSNMILIKGSFKNEKVEEKFKIDEVPWYQDWGLGLKAFINTEKNSTLFWSIDPNKLRIAKFEVKKEKIEKILVNNQEMESVYAKVNLTGFLKIFWSGEMWFRKSDGTCVLFKMNPKDSKDITQLIEEK